MNILHTESQLAYTIDDKLILSKQVQECFDKGHRAECLSTLWKCYQIAPYFLPL